MSARRTKVLAALAAAFALAASLPLAGARQGEQGDPFVRNFPPREYGAFTQNWSIVQDGRGFIYAGNNSGALEYDGVRWRLIPNGNKTIVRSLAVGPGGRVYAGGTGEIGYLLPDPIGETRYVSLTSVLDPADRSFMEVWSVIPLAGSVYFQSYDRLFRVTGEKAKAWKPATTFLNAFAARERLYVQDDARGLLRLEGNDLVPVPGGERFAGDKVVAGIPWEVPGKPEALLVATLGRGFFLHDGTSAVPFPTEVDRELTSGRVEHVLRLSDGTLGAATNQFGMLHLSGEGKLLGRVGTAQGLLIDSIKYLYEDSQHGIWMALNKGLSRVELLSPQTRFDDRRGLPGTVFSVHRHGGVVYAGSEQGLFRLEHEEGRGAHFHPVPGVREPTWSYLSLGNRLLVATGGGVFEVDGNRATRVFRGATPSYRLEASRRDPSRVWVGLQRGLGSCRLVNGRWVDEGLFLDYPAHVRSIHESDDGSLWLGTFSQGVLHVFLPGSPGGGEPRVVAYGVEKGLPSLRHTYVARLAGGLKTPSHDGVYRYRPDADRFEPDPAFAGFFPEGPRWVYGLREDAKGRIWMQTSDESRGLYEPGVALPRPGEPYSWDGKRCIRFSGSWVESLLPEEDGVVWFCSSEGLVRLDTTAAAEQEAPYATAIREVRLGDERGRTSATGAGGETELRVPWSRNRLRVEFAAPSYGMESASRFQVLLDGFETAWWAWAPEAFKEYSNLPPGRYTFRVRARNAYGTEGAEAAFAFRVLAPWYRTWWAFALWLLCGGGAVLAGVHLHTRKLRRENERLEALVAERTRELREASLTDPLTGTRNRRFINEILDHDVTVFAAQKRRVLEGGNRRAGLSPDTVIGLALLDIDHFKEVNDTWGHDAGDQVLRQFAATLRRSCRQDDVVLRVGGEEFLVVLKATQASYIPVYAEKIRKRIEALEFDVGGGRSIHRTCSIGYSGFTVYDPRADALSFEQTIMVCDLALYHAKTHGRNRAVGLRAGPNVPRDEETIRKVTTQLEFALQGGYLVLDGESGGEPLDGRPGPAT